MDSQPKTNFLSSPAGNGLDKLVALIADDSYAVSFQSMSQYRTALIAQARAAIGSASSAMSDYVLMPRRLTAENGAKGVLSGEFKEFIEVTCHACGGSGDDDESDNDAECAECKGDGIVTQDVPVSWDTIKDVYKSAVELLAAPAAAAAPAELTASQIAASAAVLDDDGKPVGRNVAIMVADAMQVAPAENAKGTVTLDEALFALDLVINKMNVPGLSGQRAYAVEVLARANQTSTQYSAKAGGDK